MNVNLNIHQNVFDIFLSAQSDSSTIRYLKIIIEDETMVLSNSINKVSTADVDFDKILVKNLDVLQPSLYVYSLKDHFLSAGNNDYKVFYQ